MQLLESCRQLQVQRSAEEHLAASNGVCFAAAVEWRVVQMALLLSTLACVQ
jgi:hypothetical protein